MSFLVSWPLATHRSPVGDGIVFVEAVGSRGKWEESFSDVVALIALCVTFRRAMPGNIGALAYGEPW